jgi:hypothetical protein
MTKYMQRHIIFILLIALTSVLSAVAATMFVLADRTFYDKYSYIRFVDSKDSINLTDEDFYDNCAKVVFPVNKFGLPKNDMTLEELEKEVLPRVNEDSLELVAIVIRGAASPEGPFLNNKRLAQNRAKALTDFITSRLTFKGESDSTDNQRALPKAITQDYDIEDYRSLCIAMKKADDPDYDYVKGICDKYLEKNDMRHLKSTLMYTRGGKLWRRLLQTYYPQLRSARIMLFFRKYKEPEPIIPEPEPEIIPVDTVDTEPISDNDTLFVSDVRLPRKKLLAVKTNLLLDLAYMPGYDRWCPIPNIALEYYPLNGHFTFGASFDMPWWQDYNAHKFFQFRNYQIEGRYYWKGATSSTNETSEASIINYNKNAYTGFYLQGYAHTAVFGICFDANRGWVGEGVGAGIGAGYVMPLSRNGHWKLELGLQLGFFRCQYDPYRYENPVNPSYHDNLYYYKWTMKREYFRKRQYRWSWIGPTRVGITLSYDLLYRKRPVVQRSNEIMK